MKMKRDSEIILQGASSKRSKYGCCVCIFSSFFCIVRNYDLFCKKCTHDCSPPRSYSRSSWQTA